MKLRTLIPLALLFMGLSTVMAQEPATNSPGKISITISNSSDAYLIFTLREEPGRPQPGQTFMRPPEVISKTVAPQKSEIVAMLPAQYFFITAPTETNTVWPIQGYVSITNSELWVFSAQRKTNNFVAGTWPNKEWRLDIPVRPGFRLADRPERPQPFLPQRTRREDYHSTGLALPPQRTLRLPASMQTNGNP